jgi:hypothetical protein
VARGWESKSVEAQQEERARQAPVARPLSGPDEARRVDRQRTLHLTRARILHDLDRASAAAHRRMLEQALAAIDQQIAALEG